jgi:hypothetical protein
MEGSAVFEVGQAVEVDESVGSIEPGGQVGTITDGPDESGYFTVSIEGQAPVRASAEQLSPYEPPREGVEETAVAEPPSVFDQLGRDYASATEDRRETFAILPGRFHGNLFMRAKPVDPIKRKKKVRRIAKTGISDEAEARFAAELIAESCECILVRLGDGEDPIPANEVPNSGLGDEPVRFDQRLGKVVPPLGEILTGNESPAAIVRLLFKNMDALDGFFVELDQWLKESSPTEGGDEDEDGAERPT